MSLTYINPVELLNLTGKSAAELDSNTIKKARRLLLADLELGDGTLEYKGQRLDRSACERACAELDEPARLRLWSRLASMPALNNFLGEGQLDFLLNPGVPTSLGADAEFIRMVGPRYAMQLDKALLAAFKARNATRLQQIVVAPVLYLPTESRQAYQSLSRVLREKIDNVQDQVDAFEEDDDETQVVANLNRVLTTAGWPSLLNILPDAAFSGIRTDFALAVRNFSIQFFNTYFEPATPLKLLQEAASLRVDNQASDRLREDIRQIREIEAKQQARAKVDAVAERLGKAFEQMMSYQRQLDAGEYLVILTIKQWSAGLPALITELNQQTDEGLVQARDAMALGLRGLSVEIWNKSQSSLDDIWNSSELSGEAAIALLNVGLTLRVSNTTSAKLSADKNQLTKLMNEQRQEALRIVQHLQTGTNKRQNISSNTSNKASNDNNSGCLVFIIIAVVIGVLVAMANSCSSGSATTTETTTVEIADTDSGAVSGTTNSVDDGTANAFSAKDPSETTPTYSGATTAASGSESEGQASGPSELYQPAVSPYAGNQLRNGASPLENCFGHGRYAGPAWITFKNDNSDTDAIVCLARLRDNKVIRNEYIRAGTSFRMSRIPAGTYYLKVFYGRDWNPTSRNACGTKGNFDTDQRFSESRDPSDLVSIESNGYSYTTGTLTLYTVAGGNMAQQPIDAQEFFRQ